MSAMETMIGNMLKSAIPPEVMELLSPEKVQEFGERINGFIHEMREGQDRILLNQDAILNRLEILEKGLEKCPE